MSSQTKTEPAPSLVPPELPPPLTSNNTTPRFSPADVLVIFVLGGPGSGKGTQSAHLVRDYGFSHLSAGDLLRAEQDREGSQYGDLIRHNIREGIIVPMEITVALLSNAMSDILQQNKTHVSGSSSSAAARFLIDGFPRKMDQAVFFEETVVPSTATLFLSCPEEVMLERLLKRGETSGRSDDNIESIRKRFRVFVEQSMPVVEYYEKEGKVMSVSSVGTVDEVYGRIRGEIERRGIHAVVREN
ncbi:bifunctional uridylate/adenylate kinase [Emydomyces testavorans]|uniref:Uridylate kinase n=1 Tax=Emydomyces testavorans TaxID=2070801 RepID=A0AAF0IJM8_9EURO|nr:bifunctional uridylate/adenylate kinase [Emydomyces testavorans]